MTLHTDDNQAVCDLSISLRILYLGNFVSPMAVLIWAIALAFTLALSPVTPSGSFQKHRDDCCLPSARPPWPPLSKESSGSSRKPLSRARRSPGVCVHLSYAYLGKREPFRSGTVCIHCDPSPGCKVQGAGRGAHPHVEGGRGRSA